MTRDLANMKHFHHISELQCETLHLILDCTALRNDIRTWQTSDNTYQTSPLSQMSTDINKHLQTGEQTVIREEANRRSLCWTEHFLLVLSGLPALTSWQWQVSSSTVVRSQGCNGWMKGLHQKVLMETSWTWNTSLTVKTAEAEEVREIEEETDTET